MSLMQMNYLYCAILIVIGVAGYFLTNRVSVTALIPAIFGVVLAFLNYFTVHSLSSTMAIVGMVVTIIGMLGAARVAKSVIAFFRDGAAAGPAMISQILFLLFSALILFTFWRMYGVLSR